jgi:hypothetical protein
MQSTRKVTNTPIPRHLGAALAEGELITDIQFIGRGCFVSQAYDILGYRTWGMDERGFITHDTYGTVTGAMIQQIEDVDTSIVSGVPSGWTTPSGGGQNLVTDYEVDDQGRTIQELGPSHPIDLNGTATTIRTAIWTVYDDENHTVRIGHGYATGTSPDYDFILINPVQITIRDENDRLLEKIQATRANTAGKLLSTDTFGQSSYVRWTTYQYLDCCLGSSRILVAH